MYWCKRTYIKTYERTEITKSESKSFVATFSICHHCVEHINLIGGLFVGHPKDSEILIKLTILEKFGVQFRSIKRDIV